MKKLNVEFPEIWIEGVGYIAIEGYAFSGDESIADAQAFFAYWGGLHGGCESDDEAAMRTELGKRLSESDAACNALLTLWANWESGIGSASSPHDMNSLENIVEALIEGVSV